MKKHEKNMKKHEKNMKKHEKPKFQKKVAVAGAPRLGDRRFGLPQPFLWYPGRHAGTHSEAAFPIVRPMGQMKSWF